MPQANPDAAGCKPLGGRHLVLSPGSVTAADINPYSASSIPISSLRSFLLTLPSSLSWGNEGDFDEGRMNACSDKHKSNVCGRDGKLHRFPALLRPIKERIHIGEFQRSE